MKAKRRVKLRALVGDMVLAELAIAKSDPTFSVITVTFENRSVEIPYLPWQPRTKVSLPGRWVEPDASTPTPPPDRD